MNPWLMTAAALGAAAATVVGVGAYAARWLNKHHPVDFDRYP